VRTTAGDYNLKQLAMRMDTSGLVGDIISHWIRLGERRKTVCFATSVDHSIHIRDEFNAHGVRCEHIDGQTPEDQRKETLARLASGDVEVVTNCAVLTEGWDMPEVGRIILARPTKSFQLYRQMIGRVIRASSETGKKDAIVLDHSGATYRHGRVEDPIEWTLDEDHKLKNKTQEERASKHSERKLVECPKCEALRTAGEACPHCGYLPQRRGEAFVCDDGELGLIQGGRAKATLYDAETKHRWWRELTAIGNERGYARNWAAVNFKEKFGHYPGPYGAEIEPMEPTAEVWSWVRSRQIRYAKSKKARSVA
jgi:DNA repair protein RadD